MALRRAAIMAAAHADEEGTSSKHREQIVAAAKGGGSFKLEGKPGDMKELAEAFERAKAAV